MTDFRATTSVVVPSFHEDPDILMSALETWRAQDPTEIIVVLDIEDLDAYDRITALGGRDHPAGPVPPRRQAVGAGRGHPRCDVRTPGAGGLRHLLGAGPARAVQMPFVDPTVGGVGTQQNVYQRRTSVWRRIADWLVNLRYYDYVPAMGRAGAVACLSGRTAGYRRAAIDARAGEPGERVLPGPALRRRRRRTADLAGAGIRLQDRAPVLRAGDVDVPFARSAPSSSSGCAGAGTPTAAI